MALEVKITVTLSSDKTSVDIEDNGTNWGVGGNPGTGDVTSIIAKVYKRDSASPDYEVTFTSGERTTFLSGSAVTLNFTDSRWFGETYAPDNFYTVQLYINSTYTSDSGYFSLLLDLEQLVHKNTSSALLTPVNLVKSQILSGSNMGIDTLNRIDADIDATRKIRWGIIYDFIYANITSKFKSY